LNTQSITTGNYFMRATSVVAAFCGFLRVSDHGNPPSNPRSFNTLQGEAGLAGYFRSIIELF
jgi:hypothetical protein